MPYSQTLANRYNRRSFSVGDAYKLAKQAMTFKKEYEKAKAKKDAMPKRKTRSDKGKKRNVKRPVKGRTFTPITSLTVGAPGASRASMKRKMINKKFPQKLKQIYYLTNEGTYLDIDTTSGTITNPDVLYSTPSTETSNASIMLFNVSCCANHWIPEKADASQGLGYRTGNQLCPADNTSGNDIGYDGFPNNSFIYRNNGTSTKLTSAVCPFWQNGLAESASVFVPGIDPQTNNTYTVPNHILDGISVNIMVHNPLICPQKISIKVVRYDNGDDTPLLPGSFGSTASEAAANVNSLVNARTWCGRGYKVLWHKTISMPGIRGGTKLKKYPIKKYLSLNYLRSQYRKTYNANSMATLGLQATPSYGLAEDGFFNACYIIVSSTVSSDNYISTCSIEKNATNPETRETGIPQIATYPPVGLADVGYQTIGRGAQFGIEGRMGVYSSVKETSRSIGTAEITAFSNLQKQIDELKLLKDVNKDIDSSSDSDSTD